MSEEPVWSGPAAELMYLRARTPTQQTPPIVNRVVELTGDMLLRGMTMLRESYDIDYLRSLLPCREQCYAVIRAAACMRLPEEPSVQASMASDLRTALTNMQADVTVYLIAASAALRKIDTVIDRLRGQWAEWSPSDVEWRVKAEFARYAADILMLRSDAETMSNDAERVYWILNHMLEQLDKNVR